MVNVILHLNARLQPMHRGDIFEDLFEEVFSEFNIGELIGAGTLQEQSGEINSCNIEMKIKKNKMDSFLSFLNKMDIIPKGSNLTMDNEKIEMGCAEGLALYLNGTELPEEIYKSYDINNLIELLDESLNDVGQRLSHWEGSAETALYYYGKSYIEMKDKVDMIVNTHPLCQKCRIVRIS